MDTRNEPAVSFEEVNLCQYLGLTPLPQFDVYHDQLIPYPYHDETIPIPKYSDVVNQFTIVDEPHLEGSPNAPATWTLEDCAVCRTHSGNSTSDTVLGCVKFVFHIANDGTRTLSVQTQTGNQTGKDAYTVGAEKPGDLWHKALARWRIPGNQP